MKRFVSAAAAAGLIGAGVLAVATPANAAEFSSAGSITIPAAIHGTGPGPSDPYPSIINVAGAPASIQDVNVRLNGWDHTFLGDLHVVVVAPNGTGVSLWGAQGGGSEVHTTVTFDDSGATFAGGDLLSPVALKPLTGAAPVGAPAGPYAGTLSALNGSDPNGAWSLYIYDDQAFDVGNVDNWSIEINNQLLIEPSRISVNATQPNAIEGGGDGVVRFSRSQGLELEAVVRYDVTGTASSGSDFTPLSGTVTIPEGQTFVDVPINALADGTVDNNETVIVTIRQDGGYEVGTPSSATVTITERQGFPVCAGAAPENFSDVGPGDVHAANIGCADHLNFVVGYPDGTFKPSNPISRAQGATIVRNVADRAGVMASPTNPNPYADVEQGNVHRTSILILDALGVLDGATGETKPSFFPSANLSRGDAAHLLYNVYEEVVGSPLLAGPNAFTDDDSTDDNAEINALAQAGVVNGVAPGQFNPSGTISRAQFATMVIQLVQLADDAGADFS